jgi:arylsulfatase A-like enzyme
VRAASLFGVLVFAKLLTLAGRDLPFSPWAPLAYVWQDIAVALLFGIVDAAVGRPAVGRLLYAAAVTYIAINVPVTLVLSSPLTLPMIRAARGPLADSLTSQLTLINLASVAAVLAAGACFPLIVKRLGVSRAVVAIAVVLAALGPIAVARTETAGLHRNAFGALAGVSVPPSAIASDGQDWRHSPFQAEGATDLNRYTGIARGRNVLLVALESTAARYLGLYGASTDPMPTLTALSQQALVVNSAYAVYPESIKGLFSTLCSRFPAFSTPPEAHAEARCESLPSRLAGAGYSTALFHSGRFSYLGMDAIIARQGFHTLEDAGAIGGNVNSSFGVDEPATVARILSWIDAHPREQPFFATYMPVAGHHPYATNAPGPFDDGNEFGRYLNALHEGDAALGTLLKGLRDRGRDRETLIVAYGDHGEAFGQHSGNSGHTLFIYDENIRVPLVFAAPGAIGGDVRIGHVASLIDVTPTILDLLGLPAQAGHEGASLLEPRSRMALFFTDYSLGWLGLRDGCHKFIHELDADRSKLFDVCTDPDETVDVAPGAPARVAAYRQRVRGWVAAARDGISRASRRP